MDEHNIFYVPAGSLAGAAVLIKGSQLAHIKGALRKRKGERIYLTDGRGCLYEAEINSLTRSSMSARILHKRMMPRKYDVDITLAFAPLKGMRNEMIIEKGTELGVARFVLFPSLRSVVRNMSSRKIVRFTKIAQGAMTQSQQYYLPEITYAKSIDDLFVRDVSYDQMYVAEPSGTRVLPTGGKRILLLIGPEGGFAESELDSFLGRGVQTMYLGPARLRSETAAIAGITRILLAAGQI
ncbi:MAG: 16S rRNA (uracil(1498)-N(3))-methyltransferase [candidate division WOR-3 bacterium]|nr:MAG: 16S rRNA (uracil(1498)-N(3))-methyltransferase [candidate division WOR-3 bacterium]